MTKAEKKILEKITEYRAVLFFLIITLIGAFVRFQGRTLVSGDMQAYLLPWYEEMSGKGIQTLREQVGDYNLLYQELLVLLTYLHWKPMYLIKALSILFDYLLAFEMAAFAGRIKSGKSGFEGFRTTEFQIVYAVVLLLPTVVFNSAYWGQCDAIYSFFALAAVFAFYEEKYNKAFVLLGVAFAFKLQTIFILPFIVCLYFYKKNFSLLKLFWTVLVFWLSGVPAYLMGRSPLAAFRIYMEQTNGHRAMYFHCPSVWMFVGGDCDHLEGYAVLLAAAILGIGLYLVLAGKRKLDGAQRFFTFACWTLWTCAFFLPNMHERYGYLLDLLWIVLVVVNSRYLPYAVVSIVMSTMGYGFYLFGNSDLNWYCAAIALTLWCLFTYKELICGESADRVEHRSVA